MPRGGLAPEGQKGIGPRLYPYRSTTPEALIACNGLDPLFYSKEPDVTKVKCPWAKLVPGKKFIIALEDIILTVPCEDGRIAATDGGRHEFNCCVHLPPSERIPLEHVFCHSSSPGCETYYYSRYPEKSDPKFVPPKRENVNPVVPVADE